MMSLVYAGIVTVLAFQARSAPKTPWQALLPIAAFSVPIQGILIFLGLKHLDATVANLVIQIQVPFAVILGWIAGGDVFSFRKLLGTFVAILGVVLVIGWPEERPPLWPVLSVIAGSLFWAIGQVLTRRLGRDDGLLQLKGVAMAGLPQLILATLLFERGQWQAVATAGLYQWLALAFVGVIGFYCAYAAWYALLRRLPIDTVAPFTLLMPVVGIVTAALVLGETIEMSHIIGGLIIVGGLMIIVGFGSLTQSPLRTNRL